MKTLLSFVTFCFAGIVTVSASEPKLEIAWGERDTVYTANHHVVGVTNPDAAASINGEKLHVYKTGCFGKTVTLSPGDNKVNVAVVRGADTATKVLDVYYETAPRKRSANAEEQTVKLEQPVNIMTVEGAYLQYGNGGDRLGGSKMGYLVPGVPMTAIGETSSLYEVKLSECRTAYVSKEYVTAGGDGAKCVNTGSWSVSNDGKADKVVISLPYRLPYYYRDAIDPLEIRVSLYGAMNNSNWITQRGALGIIDFVNFEQTDSDVLTAVIRLKDKHSWGYSVEYEGNNLVIEVRHRPESLALKDLKIGLDAGHGAKNPGAVSASGLKEADINIDIVNRLAELLKKAGAEVVLSRTADTDATMAERRKIFRDANIDLLISVHNNAVDNPFASLGTSTYYKHISNRELAHTLCESMLTLGVNLYGVTGNFNFSLNQPTEYPNALVEGLFMSSLEEEELLANPDYRQKMAQKIFEGLKNYLKACQK